jgi:hypothetical protein
MNGTAVVRSSLRRRNGGASRPVFASFGLPAALDDQGFRDVGSRV